MATAGLVLGTMYFGTRTNEATSIALLDRYVDAGGTVLDTANVYASWLEPGSFGGQSEAVLGRWLRSNPGVRDKVQLSSKVGVGPSRAAGSADHPEGLSSSVIAAEARRSIDRLGVDHLDVYWAHAEDRSVDLAETVAAFGRLVSEGLVRRLGASNHPTWRVEQARALAAAAGCEPFTALQLTTSYVAPRPHTRVPGKDHRFGFVTDETVDYVESHADVELWAYSPLVQGSYSRTSRPFPEVYDHPGTTRRLAVLAEVSSDLGATPNQVVLAWLLGGRPSIRPIIGVSSLEQLDEALVAESLELSARQRERLDNAS